MEEVHIGKDIRPRHFPISGGTRSGRLEDILLKPHHKTGRTTRTSSALLVFTLRFLAPQIFIILYIVKGFLFVLNSMADATAAAAAAAQAKAYHDALIETWTLYGAGTIFIMLRVFVRTKLVGFRGYRPDDYLIWVGWVTVFSTNV